MKNLTLILRSNITDSDVFDSISKDAKALLIDEDNCWIEVSDNGFFVSDGLIGTRTKCIIEATTALIKFKIDNKIF